MRRHARPVQALRGIGRISRAGGGPNNKAPGDPGVPGAYH